MHCFIIFFKIFFLCRLFLKSIEFVTILPLFYVLFFFGPEACGIVAPQPSIEPIPSVLEGEVNYWTAGAVLTGSCFYLEQPQGFPGGSDGSA